MRASMAVVVSVVLLGAAPAAGAHARSTPFGGAHTGGVLGSLSFGVQIPKKASERPGQTPGKRPNAKDLAATLAALKEGQRAAQPPIDCKMVRPVNPAFHSAMPVKQPDGRVQLPSRILVVPSCNQEKP
jgi:hypothetical protein